MTKSSQTEGGVYRDAQMEVCVDDYHSFRNAVSGGANHIELCSSLAVGGLTPSIGLVDQIYSDLNTNEYKDVRIRAMVRCRGGDFIYTEEEIQIMVREIQYMNHKMDGIVIGALNRNDGIDIGTCRRLIDAFEPNLSAERSTGRGLPVTFHRAADIALIKEPDVTMAQLNSLRVDRLLSNGYYSDTADTNQIYSVVVEKCRRYGIQFVIGGGVNTSNVCQWLDRIYATAGAPSHEVLFHASCSVNIPIADSTPQKAEYYKRKKCSEKMVKEIIQCVREYKGIIRAE